MQQHGKRRRRHVPDVAGNAVEPGAENLKGIVRCDISLEMCHHMDSTAGPSYFGSNANGSMGRQQDIVRTCLSGCHHIGSVVHGNTDNLRRILAKYTACYVNSGGDRMRTLEDNTQRFRTAGCQSGNA